MSQYKSQIQNLFLSMARKRHQIVEIVLNTGTTLRGKVKGYDQFSLTLVFKDKVEVLYKSAILYISLLPRKRRPIMRPMSPGRGTGGPGPTRFQGGPGSEPGRPSDDFSRPPAPRPVIRKPPTLIIDPGDDPPPPKKRPRE
jgi:host factor-I protein